EPDMVPYSSIASVSLGDTREMSFRYKGEGYRCMSFTLEDRDLLVMTGSTQEIVEHRTEKMKERRGSRYNLTFRVVLSGDGTSPMEIDKGEEKEGKKEEKEVKKGQIEEKGEK